MKAQCVPVSRTFQELSYIKIADRLTKLIVYNQSSDDVGVNLGV